MCHGSNAAATGYLAHKSNPPTPDLTTPAFQKRLREYPGVIVSSVVLRPNGNLIPNILKENGVKVPPHIWTEDELRSLNIGFKNLCSRYFSAHINICFFFIFNFFNKTGITQDAWRIFIAYIYWLWANLAFDELFINCYRIITVPRYAQDKAMMVLRLNQEKIGSCSNDTPEEVQQY